MILDSKRQSTILHSVEKSLWKRLWTCRKRYDGMNRPELLPQVRILLLEQLKRIKNRIAYVFWVGSGKIVSPLTKTFIVKIYLNISENKFFSKTKRMP